MDKEKYNEIFMRNAAEHRVMDFHNDKITPDDIGSMVMHNGNEYIITNVVLSEDDSKPSVYIIPIL